MIDEQQQEDMQEKIAEQLQVFGSRLLQLAQEQVRKRATIEQRWLKDLRQYHGEYDLDTKERLKNSDTSEVFVNITRNKSNAAEARIQDMLFPTDDRNWAITPTPVPELSELKDVEPEKYAVIMRQAKKQAELMQAEIDDQLVEANYQAKARDMMHDAVVLGTGIIKAPCIVGKTKKQWVEDEYGNTVLNIVEDVTPSAEYVSIWDFYPDMTALKLDDCDFFFERHKWNKKQLRQFAKLPNVFIEQVQNVASTQKGEFSATDRENDIRSITGVQTHANDTRYEIWEYHGAISKEELAVALMLQDDPMFEADELDALNDEIEATVFLSSRGTVLKVALNPMDTQERPYSALAWEKDDGSVFGFGIPYLMRTAQAIINSAWRMMIDNSGQAVTDQVVVNSEIVEPVDGKWTLGAKKMWRLTDVTRSVQEAFGVFETRNHQAEYANIIQMARQFADEETNMPLIAQGEQSSHVTKTSSGMAMLMNSANIVLRRAVKNWDDDVTTPVITRFYDWNMQFNNNKSIKGDYCIRARGSSALLVREKQQENLMIFANVSAQNPELFAMRDWEGLDREMAKALEVPYENITLTEEDIQQRQQQAAQQAQQSQDDGGQADMQLKAQELELKAQSYQQNYELKVAELALKENLTMAQMKVKLDADLMKDKTQRDKAAADIAHKREQANMQAQNLAAGYDTF